MLRLRFVLRLGLLVFARFIVCHDSWVDNAKETLRAEGEGRKEQKIRLLHNLAGPRPFGLSLLLVFRVINLREVSQQARRVKIKPFYGISPKVLTNRVFVPKDVP